jgi:hypothetical protein
MSPIGARLAPARARARRLQLLPLLAAALLAAPSAVRAASFGVPAGPGSPPAGYFMLVSSDAVDPARAVALGDDEHELTFHVESRATGLRVDLYDPGLFDPARGAGQLDVNLDTVPPVDQATIRYVLYGPLGGVLADQTFGPDTAATDLQLVTLFDDPGAAPGLYRLQVLLGDGVPQEQDVAVFGLSVPGHAVYTFNATVGHCRDGGATIMEPLALFPYLSFASAGTDPFGPLDGATFVSYDLDADMNGVEPPSTSLLTRSGYLFPSSEVLPSGDARWWETHLGGVQGTLLDSTDHGLWRWDFSALDVPETVFGSVTPPLGLNAFSVQVLDYQAPPRDFDNWPSLPPFGADAPRRIYLPRDDGTAPVREWLGHRAEVVAGFPVIAQGETSTLEVTVTFDNPNPYDLTNVVGETHVIPDPIVTDPVLVSATGLAASINPGDPKRIDWTGTVAAGTAAVIVYRVDITPTALGRAFLTGDGSDFVSVGAPTVATYQTPYTPSQGLLQEIFGPIGQIEYESVIPPCAVLTTLQAERTQACPGTPVILEGTMSAVYNCPGGVPIYQWLVNGAVLFPFPASDTITVTPYLDDTYTLEVACSTLPATCIDDDSITFALYPALLVDAGTDVSTCPGGTVDLTAVISNGTPPTSGYLWTTSPPGEPGDGATTLAISVTPSQTTTYTFRAEDSLACEGTDAVVVTIAPPMPAIAPDPPALCVGGSVVLSATPGFAGYAWTTSPPGEAGDGATTPDVMATAIGVTYTVTVTDAAGCTGQAVATTVEAPPPPIAIAPDPAELCAGGSLVLSATPGFATYAWATMPPGAAGDGATTPDVVAMDVGVTYTVTAVDAAGCTAQASATTAVPPPFVPGITPPAPAICAGDTVQLVADPGYASYAWTTLPPGESGDGATTPDVTALRAGVAYSVTVTDDRNCTGQAEVTVAAADDTVPGPVGPTLRLARSGAADLEQRWADIPDPAADYEVVSLDCDSDLDGACDTDPTPGNLASMPDRVDVVAVGAQVNVEPGGLSRPSWLVFYKVRATSPCTGTPGPFGP